jgi:hypothetical protein
MSLPHRPMEAPTAAYPKPIENWPGQRDYSDRNAGRGTASGNRANMIVL